MRFFLGIVLATIAITGVAGLDIKNRGMPDPTKLYHLRADCHIAYDLLISELDNGKQLPAFDIEWAKAHENAGKAGQTCPAVPQSIATRAKDRAIATNDGRAVTENYWNKQKDPVAAFELGFSYLNGMFADKTPGDGVALIQQAADKGDPNALFILGTMHNMGSFGKKDYKKGLPLIEAAAKSGQVDALFRAGVMNYEGVGTSKNPKKAFGYFEQAARSGHLFAATMAATMLTEGKGVPKDTARAYRIALAIAEEGEVYGMALASGALMASDDAQKHKEDALYWLDQAIRNGDSNVQGILNPIRQQAVKAYARQAAAGGYSPAARKACPMKTVCTVNHYSGLQSCTTSKDYWNDCDG
ncbi:tetratricopeptide repeat protein [uncultured Sphingorhabdus sp.]|uniref:tetratricopeptide repeat protein n=1 Tax=uncultured Sphingorhabdus sp. TaxID=1686106 RepID=UPI002636D52E|nr:tetratricopeptide repeat protein [uncultured Sphingorhabdus sp.]HMS21138.1 tetratricopeptide repeat protein [Sphingorhabdus sp.]